MPDLAPANMLTASAASYLDSLAQAVQVAAHDRDAAALAERYIFDMRPDDRSGRQLADPGNALNLPLNIVLERRHAAITANLHQARDNHAFVAAWYAEVALLALQNILAGQQFTGRDLERDRAYRPGLLTGNDDTDQAAFWEPTLPLPALGDLLTGHENLDRRLSDTYIALADVRQAADVVRKFSEDVDDLPEQELRRLGDAERKAARIPDLMIQWADALHCAAERARSVSHGHKVAVQVSRP